jgi:hypothetical protein
MKKGITVKYLDREAFHSMFVRPQHFSLINSQFNIQDGQLFTQELDLSIPLHQRHFNRIPSWLQNFPETLSQAPKSSHLNGA